MKICKQALAAILACALLSLPVLPAKAATSAEDVLNALWAACAAGDYDTAMYCISNESNQAVFDSLMNENGEYRSIDPQTGKMLGIFHFDLIATYNDDGTPYTFPAYFVYYGDQKDGLRSGSGVWMHQEQYEFEGFYPYRWIYFSSGEWANDMPNGYWNEKFEWLTLKDDGIEQNSEGVYAEGPVVNGLWNDEITMTYTFQSSYIYSEVYTFKNGFVVPLDRMLDSRGEYAYKVTDRKNAGWWVEASYNSTWGINGFAQSNFVFKYPALVTA